MANVFFIGDTHFGHKNVITFGHRNYASVYEHDEAIVDNWNKVVNKNDIVWHLGDVAFGKRHLQTLERLKGIKKLVMGNHDHYRSEDYLKYFHKLYGAASFDDMILTHIPVAASQLIRYKVNIHGHLHQFTQSFESYDALHRRLHIAPDPRYVCVSCEQINMTPISMEELRGRVTRLQ